MITACFFKSDDRLCGFAVNGHDTPDDSGVSLLCAAVSSAVYLTVNTITDICKVTPLVLEQGDGLLTLRLQAQDAVTCAVPLEGLRLHLQALRDDYKDFITVNITEV